MLIVTDARFPFHKIGRRIGKQDWPIRLLRTRDENMIDTRTSTPLICRVNVILQNVA